MAEGACVAGGHVWQGACMAGGGMHSRVGVWQERWPLRRTVSIPLECILVLRYDSVQKGVVKKQIRF